MNRPGLPAIDHTIVPVSGMTRDGQPISYNRAPAADLAPWVGRFYVSKVDAPPHHRLSCGLLGDSSYLRIQLKGQWTGRLPTGTWEVGRSALFFGPQTRRMAVTVTGPFVSAGIAFAAGACYAMRGPKMVDWLDLAGHVEDVGQSSEMWMSQLDPEGTPEEWCAALEDMVRQMVDASGGMEPDPLTRRFDCMAYTDPSTTVSQFARDAGVDLRRLERVVRRDFGISPKQVLRRARALDMASHLRGVADQAEDLALRYYDQSHLIRDFTHFFGVSPSQFVERPQPLMTLGLETRQARRLELIARLAPGDIRPWE